MGTENKARVDVALPKEDSAPGATKKHVIRWASKAGNHNDSKKEEIGSGVSTGEQGEAVTTDDDGWGDPILFVPETPKEIKSDTLPSWLGGFTSAISQSKQTPEGLAVMLGLSIVATCVQKKYVVAPYGDDEYVEQLSLWTVTVLKSAERKSPILNALRAPIIDWEHAQQVALQDTIRVTQTERSVAQRRIDKLQQEAAKAATLEARQEILDQISQIQATTPAEVRAPKLWVADVTAEALQDLLAEYDERMALLSDEGIIFEIMAGLYNDKVNIDIFLQAYSGSPTKIIRKARQVDLNNPALTFGLAVQPSVIEDFSSGNKKKFKGKGALGRFLYCVPSSMLGKRSVSERVRVPAEVKSQYEQGIRSLLNAPRLRDEAGRDTPRMLQLAQEALDTWENFASQVEAMIGPDGELSSMDDWGGKLPGNALRVAGIMHLVENGPDVLVIGKATMERAVSLCTLLIGHAKLAYGMIGADEPLSVAKKIFCWMCNRGFGTFTRTECSDSLFKGTVDKDALDEAFQQLEERNILKEYLIPTAGRSAKTYVSNPALK